MQSNPELRPSSRLVLVADDFQDGREALVELLTAIGYRTVEARDGGEALGLIATASPDLVLLDLTMPVLTGLEVLERLSVRERPPRTIVMSGSPDTRAIPRYPFVSAVLTKCGDVEHLIAVVEATVAAR
jgi:CheY-like chemotaxis protein